MSKERRDAIIATKQGGGGAGITSGVSWDAFNEDGELTSATVYGNILKYGAFYEEYMLSTLVFKNPIKEIQVGALNSCELLGNLDSNTTSELEIIGINAFSFCYGFSKIWIPLSCHTITTTENVLSTPFRGCNSDLTIYCEAESKPAGWGEYWNYYDDENQLTVVWGVSKAEFDAL